MIDKLLYGGFGYGKFCIPDELPNVIIAIVFPPASILWNYHLELQFMDNNQKIYYMFISYISLLFPGLIYAINELSCRAEAKVNKN